ncbi:MAG: J domain-containing protein [Cyanobacteria bacterium J06642_11]
MGYEGDLRYPLQWPAAKLRTKRPAQSRFDPYGRRTFAQARDELLHQLKLLGAKHIQISSNIPLRNDGLPRARFKIDDHGIAVYFRLKEEKVVLACDVWSKAVDNIWAIAKTVEAQRGIDRWGCLKAEDVFLGRALPAQTSCPSWQTVLELNGDISESTIKVAYRKLSKKYHPDTGGNRAKWDQLNEAYQAALEHLSQEGDIP